MVARLRSVFSAPLFMALAAVSAVLAMAGEFGHLQWTTGGPSGVRGRGIPFNAAGDALWRESGVAVWGGAIGIWTVQRSIAKASYDWGGGGAMFFGVDDGMGGPPSSDRSVRWLPRVGSGAMTPVGQAAWYVTVPLWPLTAILAIGCGIWAWRRGRVDPESCARCGYDRRGLGGRPCPECAAPAKASVSS